MSSNYSKQLFLFLYISFDLNFQNITKIVLNLSYKYIHYDMNFHINQI